jgi:hypothetical protein
VNLDAWRLTRHDLLVGAGRALAGLAGLAFIGRAREARAAKVQKEDVAYQDRPKDGKACANCRQFSPTAEGKGNCAVVEGEVSASGWCSAYSPRATQSRAERAHIVAVTSTAPPD